MTTYSTKTRRHLWLVLWASYWCLAFVLTHLPPRDIGVPLFAGADKIIHFVMFAILAWLGGRALPPSHGRMTARAAITWIVVYASYAAVDEWTQRFVDRTPSVFDWFADVLGIICGLSWHLTRGLTPKRIRTQVDQG